MEPIALKSSVSRDIEMNPQNISEDYLCVGSTTTSDEFSIEEFFDIPNEENEEIFEEGEDDEQEKYSWFCSNDCVEDSTGFSTDLAIRVDDMQELELWSHLMDDTIQEPTLACPNPILDADKSKTKTKIGSDYSNRLDPVYKPGYLIPSAVPVKPRTKRSRPTTNRSWVLGSSPKTESPSSSLSLSSSSSPVSTLFFPPPVHEFGVLFGYGKQTVKKSKKKPSVWHNQLVQRKCSHCQVTKTPQWRAGPHGPKTLCNACGVRFKSGRLFPEYRPACSPTFSSEIHSNSHRKVLEMRRKKDNEPVNGLLSMVLSSYG